MEDKDPNIYDPKTGYFRNPTATKIQDTAQGNSIYLDGNKLNGPITYVLDKNENIIIGKRKNPNDSSKRSPHPTLIGGKDPQVQCARIQ